MIPCFVTAFRLAAMSRVSKDVVERLLEEKKLTPDAWYLKAHGLKYPLFNPARATDVFDACQPAPVAAQKR